MTQRRRSLFFLGLVVGLLAASLAVIAMKPTILGLDLKGGSQLILQGEPSPPEVPVVRASDINRAIDVIQRRVNAFGVSEPDIQREGNNQISVALAGVTDPSVLADLVKPAQMSFYDFEATTPALPGLPPQSADAPPAQYEDAYAVARAAARLTPAPTPQSPKPTWYMFGAGPGHALLEGPEPTQAALRTAWTRDQRHANQPLPKNVVYVGIPAGYILASQNALGSPDYQQGAPTVYYVFHNVPSVSGSQLTDARAVVQGSGTVVQLSFSDKGNSQFQKLTKLLYDRGQLKNANQHFAAVLDGELITTPYIDHTDPTLSDGIANGGVIQGNFSLSSAQRLATQLSAGAIPIPLTVIARNTVSATLGQAALHEALIAGFIGLGLVMLLMIAYYRMLGLIADGALILYGILFFAVIKLVPITMTLPGIAGMVLTIGVAADANVVIFERIREEARAGRNPRAAILNGYRRGISAIIDANVVTLITAAIIYLFATAGPKGFAFALFIGVVLSLFTAVLATRAVFEALADSRLFRNERAMGLAQREIRWKLDFVGKWRLWLAISVVPMVAGAVFIGVRGINPSIDFTGGTRVATVFTGPPPSVAAVRKVLTGAGIGEAEIQTTTNTDTGLRGISIQTKSIPPAQETRLETALKSQLGAKIQSVDSVGPTFGAQVIHNAIIAIILSFAVIILYLAVRFEFKLALPALLSVVHDVWLCLSVYALTGHEVSSNTVAALLTILGYSLYDVVIVFDRIRENEPLMRNSTYREIVNRSVHETLTRSMITSILTTVPVVMLFVFGGSQLKDFSFALLVGILAGGMSSVLISAPLAALWKEREPEGKRRRAKAERRRVQVIGSDSDVADVGALARAEAALEAELSGVRALGAAGFDGADAVGAEAGPARRDDRARRREPAEPTPPRPADAPASGEPGGSGEGAPVRERRHRQVQRKRRR